MTENASPPRSTNRWFSIFGFQFSRRQTIRAALLLAAGGLAGCVAFRAWYIPPRATSRLVRSVGGYVEYGDEQVPKMLIARLFHQQTRMVGLTATDEEIEEVDLRHSNVTDAWLYRLKPLENLRYLAIHGRQMGSGLADLAEMKKLTTIHVWNPCAGDANHLRHLPNLKSVLFLASLHEAPCSDIDLSQLASISQLSFMDFRYTSISARQFEQISQIQTLNGLGLMYARIDAAGQKGIAHLANLPTLQSLYINDVTDETAAMLAKIESLTFLRIDTVNLTDEGAASLANLRNLTELHLFDCLHPLDIDALKKRMPNCRIIYNLRPTPTR